MAHSLVVLKIVATLFIFILQWSRCYSEHRCGWRNESLSKRHIFGGIQATRSQWPWVVQLTLNGSHLCGGSLIDEMIIVTAAHCIDERIPLSWYRVSVRAPGKNESEILKIEFRDLHPSFNALPDRVSKMGHDIAVLKLMQKPQTVTPICLPTSNTPMLSNISICFVAGWGKTRGGYAVSPNGLRYVPVPILERSVCSAEWTGIDDTMICAGNYHRHIKALREGSCEGDSGGPLMCEIENQWVLLGAVNFGNWDFCLRKPGVFADIKNLLGWIKSTTHRLKDEVVNQMRREFERRGQILKLTAQQLQKTQFELEATQSDLDSLWECDSIDILLRYVPLFACSGLAECSDIKSLRPYASSGKYELLINGVLKSVYCDMDTQNGGWTVFQRRMDGSVNFKRDWLTYREGFGNILGEHWLGNEALHYMTSPGDHDLLVEMREWNRPCKLYALYSNFSVANEDHEYRLSNINFMKGTLPGHSGVGLSPHGGMSFTTPDKNDSDSSRNCAEEFHGGWWYTHYCYNVNLNGLYSKSPCVETLGHINWLEAHNWYYSFPWTEIKFRRTESRETGKDGSWCSDMTCTIQCKMDAKCGCNSNSHCKPE